jgi:hypothetical protein
MIELMSKFPMNLIDDLLAGVLDLAIADESPESPLKIRCGRDFQIDVAVESEAWAVSA